MTVADVLYGHIIRSVNNYGEWDADAPVRAKWKTDGSPAYTKSLLNVQMKFDNSKEELDSILTQKRVPQLDPINEMLWIWKFKSNCVRFLREYLGCKVWNEWEREDGTIGKAYGWQLANKRRTIKIDDAFLDMYLNGEISNFIVVQRDDDNKITHVSLDQVDYLIYTLKTNPHSRRIKTTLWCVEDLDDMSLEPCVYETHWQLWGGKLHLTVNVRSNDLGLGNPYNLYQYSILHRMIAQVTGHETGTICFNIDNAHVYDRHMDILLEQIESPIHEAPKVWINPNIKSFYDFTIDDIKLIDYEHEKSRKMEIAI
ncbi:thymidylate synthase [Bacillus wiedmannii]|uniref:thymidylate synthase n=1 Tax=Bacillus wiedmannii TaxID=1890302 RepID=UPI0012472603|nr:thymidylate synthase [Bacillus wiedmannii]